jgi:hypothetical protein
MADLITLNDYKTYKGIAKPDSDEKIQLLITAVSDLIKAYVGHGITDNWDTALVERYELPYDTTLLYLNVYPIREIVSVEEVLGGYIGGLDSTIHYPVEFNTGYTFDNGSGTLTRIGGNWARTIEVTYKAGYATVPQQIKLAAIELISYYLNEEWKPARTMQGTSIAGPATEVGGMPKHIIPLLDNYKVGY